MNAYIVYEENDMSMTTVKTAQATDIVRNVLYIYYVNEE